LVFLLLEPIPFVIECWSASACICWRGTLLLPTTPIGV
jgi:hypothetical protein